MAAHTCPRCALRFPTHSEVREHLLADHHMDPALLEHTGIPRPGLHRREPPDPRHAGATDPDRIVLVPWPLPSPTSRW